MPEMTKMPQLEVLQDPDPVGLKNKVNSWFMVTYRQDPKTEIIDIRYTHTVWGATGSVHCYTAYITYN
jgi:hypothetical protein